jgi:xanthine dehydrogenase accessory factor
MNWLHRIAELAARDGAAARIVIVEVTGPTPRSVGAAMIVTALHAEGKIGRGAIEREAVAAARQLIAALGPAKDAPAWPRAVLEFSTGPVLGEPTGGVATLAIEAYGPAEIDALTRGMAQGHTEQLLARRLVSGTAPELMDAVGGGRAPWALASSRLLAAPKLQVVRAILADGTPAIVERLSQACAPFYVYGTGQLARALVRQLAELPFDITWVDSQPSNFPDAVPARARTVTHTDICEVARKAAAGAFHAVMTASHELDVAVSRAVVETGGFSYLGVIGSRVKRERLLARLVLEGVPAEQLAKIVCPIGLPDIQSKQPAVIAVSIAAQALIVLQADQAGTKR